VSISNGFLVDTTIVGKRQRAEGKGERQRAEGREILPSALYLSPFLFPSIFVVVAMSFKVP
jgi:hypothetical protein